MLALQRCSRRVLSALLNPPKLASTSQELIPPTDQVTTTLGLSQCLWPTLTFLRTMGRKSAQQVRNGDVLLREGNIVRVSSFFWTHGKARGGGFITCDFVDIRTGAKASVRLKNEEMVETAELLTKSFQVLYTEEGKHDSGTVHLMDPQTFDQIAVPQEIFGNASRWLVPDLMVELKFLGTEEQPVTGSVPTKIKVRVISAQPVLPRTDGTTNRHVLVEGDGVSVMVPGHIQEGDSIVVNTATGQYDSKVT